MMPTIAEALKEQTAAQHQAAEDSLVPRISGIRSVADYASILHTFYGFFQPLSDLIRKHIHPDHLPDIHERRTSELIIRDLSTLNLPVNNLPRTTSLPDISSAAQAFGALYVMEGSTLGGRVIRKMLLQHPGLKLGEEALNFFDGYGSETGPRWLSFQKALNQQPDAGPIISAAKETFTHFKNWINKTV